ncbi:MAG: GH3 auxin-responsive promoter family protein [Bdellovibrionota bacterium]
MKSLTAYLVPFVVKRRGQRMERRLNAEMNDLKASQERLLLSILSQQAATRFGKEHNFSDIASVEEFRKQVPVLDYEKMRPYVMEQDRTNKPVLLSQNPIFYAVTSGTTGQPKYIPVHEDALKAHRQCTDFFTFNLLKARPRLFDGRMLAIVSPAVEGKLESGRSFGSTSGHMYNGMPSVVRKKYIVPASVFGIADYDLKYHTILRLALEAKNITFLTTANPSTIAKLVSLIAPHIDALADDIEKGSYSRLAELDDVSRVDVVKRLSADPARAAELRLLRKEERLKIKDIWPDLQVVGVWTGGSSSIFLDQLAGQFSSETLIRDLGYLSSEFRGSVPVMSGTNAGVPTFFNCFFEFVEHSAWDDGRKDFIGLESLEDKKNYYVFITTNYGLYRYNMNDIVQVDGFYSKVPMIRFLQKGKGVTSITGEKLYESQVIQAVGRLEKELGVDSEFYVMSCDPQEARYTLYYEVSPKVKDSKIQEMGIEALDECKKFQARLDQVLGEVNIEYEAKRKSGRVNPLRVCILKRGTYENFKRFYLDQGQREGQFKIVALQFAKDIKFDFMPHVGWDGARTDSENLVVLATTRHSRVVSDEDLETATRLSLRAPAPIVSLGEAVRL